MQIKRINNVVSVSPQIQPENLAAIKAAGYTTVVNNRPDGEEPGKPTGAEIEAAARAAGLGYHAIPLGRDGVSEMLVDETRAALDRSPGPVLCYCRTGTRSTTLWALSQAGRLAPEEIIAAATHAGYDLSHLAGHLRNPVD